MATLLDEPRPRKIHPFVEIPRAAPSAHPTSTLTPGPEHVLLHYAAMALLLACGEWGALAHGALLYGLLHGLLHRDLT
jgi:hypothetical protein